MLHGFPYIGEEIPYLRALATLHVLPVRKTVVFKVLLYLSYGVQRIYLLIFISAQSMDAVREIATSYAIYQPFVGHGSVLVQGLEKHAVGMELMHYVWAPYYARLLFSQHPQNGLVRHVAFACGCKAAVQSHPVSAGIRILGIEDAGRLVRAHGMAARRSETNFVYSFNTVHINNLQ